MYRNARKLSEVRKCHFCRRDKRKCLPETRIWPGQKCEACEHYQYDCSIGLSAKEQRERKQESSGVQPVVADDLGTIHSNPNPINPTNEVEEITREWDGAAAEASLGYSQLSTTQPIQVNGQYTLSPLETSPRTPGRLLNIVQPSNHRLVNNMTYKLQERLTHIWANPEIYQAICSSRFGNTLSDMFFFNFRQIADSDDMVYASLFAFCAADSTINVEYPASLNFEVAARGYLNKAFDLLKTRLCNGWPQPGGPVRGTMMPILYSIFLLSGYGICANDLPILQFTANLLNSARSQSAAFPLALQFREIQPYGWRFRIYLADDPLDPGLICGHDTTLFDGARTGFELLMMDAARVVELGPAENPES